MNTPDPRNWLTTLLKEHPALLASMVYVAASAIGMVYSWEFLRRFGVNFFHYAQLSDFLLASLKEPFTWLLVMAAIFLVLLDNFMSRRWGRKERPAWLRWYGSSTYRLVNYLVIIGLILLFLHVFAENKAESVRSGHGERVDVKLSDGMSRRAVLLLGTTGQFIFLYDRALNRVDIHPHESVQVISLEAPGAED